MDESDAGAESQRAPGPLSGLRVVEFVGLGPAPFGCMLLADLGAEVIALRRPGSSVPALVRNRETVEVDLKDPEVCAEVRGLIAAADILVEGFRPGVMERLGLGPDDLRVRETGLIYARMTGWGQTGPTAHTAGHDLNYIAVTGALHLATRAGPRPSRRRTCSGTSAAGRCTWPRPFSLPSTTVAERGRVRCSTSRSSTEPPT